MRRRHAEFTAGRLETLQSLTRGIGLLEKAEQDAWRDAEQLSRTLEGLRTSLSQVERLNEQAWTAENWEQELTKGLTSIENARLNSIPRGKMAGAGRQDGGGRSGDPPEARTGGTPCLWGNFFRLGLALTWPLVLAIVLLAGSMALFRVSPLTDSGQKRAPATSGQPTCGDFPKKPVDPLTAGSGRWRRN